MKQITHKGTVTLETERLLLRRFVADDAQEMFENYASDDEVTRYLTWQPYKSVDETRDWILGLIDSYEGDENYLWAIVLKDSDTLIGSIGIKITATHFRGEIGYVIGRKYWNKGFMTEALNAILEFGFKELGITRIQACHHTENIASGKVMQKAGMQYEGCLKSWAITNTGELADCEMYSRCLD